MEEVPKSARNDTDLQTILFVKWLHHRSWKVFCVTRHMDKKFDPHFKEIMTAAQVQEINTKNAVSPAVTAFFMLKKGPR